MQAVLRTHLVDIIIVLFSLFLLPDAARANPEAEKLYNVGLAYFEKGEYKAAIEKLENTIELVPENAIYHQLLAKSYGREAEIAIWFRAMSLAKKTLAHLEIAAKLDSDNVDILDDLMDYYRVAPGFLGGDAKKADEIEDLIEQINAQEYNLAE